MPKDVLADLTATTHSLEGLSDYTQVTLFFN